MPSEDKVPETPKAVILNSREGLKPFLVSILDDCLYNVIHDTVLDVHRSEKKLRMQSAAVQVEATALQAAGLPTTPINAAAASAKQSAQPTTVPQGQYETSSAKYDNGRVTLKGNPFKTLKENFCPSCKLPRLLFPLTGAHARIPEDINRSYCTLHPFIQKAGHDIYGNPFPVDAGKTKKEREALRKLERQEKDNTPGSADTGEADANSAAGDATVKKLMAGGKGATYVPWHTCPNCKRSLLITKFAQHLEKCMGIGGRPARNTAAARLSGLNGSAAGSTQGSRTGTPTPSQANGNKRDTTAIDSGDEDAPPKKKMKKDKREGATATSKADGNGNGDGTGTLKRKKDDASKVTIKFKAGSSKLDASKRPPGTGSATPDPKEREKDTDKDKDKDREKVGGGGSHKRERERDEDSAPPTKPKKLKVAKDGGSSSAGVAVTAGGQ